MLRLIFRSNAKCRRFSLKRGLSLYFRTAKNFQQYVGRVTADG
jgi:hypothetical protein